MATLTTVSTKRRVTLELRTVIVVGLMLTLGFAVLLPIVMLVINSFVVRTPTEAALYGEGVTVGWGLAPWKHALTDGGMLSALWNTVFIMFLQQGLSFPLCIVLAWLIARTNMPGGATMEFLFWVAFFLPVLSMLQGWIMLFHPTLGLANVLLAKLPLFDKGPFNIYSVAGIVFAHLFTHSIPIKVMLLTPIFRNMDAALEDASRIAGAGPLRTLYRVTVPAMTPALIVLLMLAIIRAFQSAEVEILLGTPFEFFVFGSKIFDLVRTEPPLFGGATAMGLIVLIVTSPLVWYQRRASIRRQYTTISSRYQPQVLRLGNWRWPSFAFVLTFALSVTLIPIFFLLMGTFMKLYGFFDVPSGPWSLRNWTQVLADPLLLRSIKNSMLLALGGATLSVTFLTLLAYFIVRGQSRLRPTIDLMTWLPYAMPGILLALAWLWIFLRIPALTPLHGTLWALIIVMGLSGLTLGVQILKANMLQMGAELEEASYVVGGSFLLTLRKVVVPLLAPTMAVVWVIHFVTIMGNAIVPALLASSSSRPLSVLQLEYQLGNEFEPASVVGVLVVLLTVGVASIARMLGLRVGLHRGA